MNAGLGSRRILALAGVLAALALAVPRILTHMPYARLGVQLEWTPDERARVDRVVGPPSLGLLRPGDILVSMDGMPIKRPGLAASYGRPNLPREAITFGVLRDGRNLEIVVPPVRLTVWNRVRYLFVPLSAVVLAPLVAFALVWRRPDLGTAWVFFWYAALQAVSVVHEIYRFPEVEPTGWFRRYMGLYGWIACWLPAAFLHFLSVFPRPRWTAETRLRSPWFWLVVVAYVVPLFFVTQLLFRGQHDEVGFRIFESAALGIGVVALVERYGRRGPAGWNPPRSHRALALLVAALLLLAAGLGWLLKSPAASQLLMSPMLRVLIPMVGIAVLFTPVIMAFLIARDPAFDPRRILGRTVPYAALSGVLAALYLALVLLGQRLFAEATGEQAVVFNVVAALVVAFAFAPAREWVQRWLDRLFRRDPHALRRALDQAGHELLSALDPDQVRYSVTSGLARGLGRPIELEWPETGAPRLPAGEQLPEESRRAVENLLLQAGIRLENLALHQQRGAAERHAAELREAAATAELRALHAQVQPHFLFNALNALSYLTETDPAAAQRFTERLADMLRYTIEAGSRPAALLSEEIGFVEDYLGVARERYEGTLSFRYRGPTDVLSAVVPPLLLQPLVENSLKHGVAGGQNGIALVLDACRENGWLTLTFADDGGRANGAPGLGVGLRNLEQRLQRFAGQDAHMTAKRLDGRGFAVTLRWRERRDG